MPIVQRRVVMMPGPATSVTYAPAVPADWIPTVPTSAQAALDALATLNPGEYVFRPGDPLGAHDHVFTDWATLIAAYNAQTKFTGTVIFDDQFAPIILPAGLWSVDYDMIWSGWHIGITTHVVLADGFQIENATGLSLGIEMLTNDIMLHTQASSIGSNVSPVNLGIVQDVLVLQYGAKIIADGDLPLVQVDPGTGLILAIYIGGEVLLGATPVVGIAAGGTALLLAATFGNVQAGTFAGAGDLFTLITIVNPNIHTSAAEQPLVTGSVTVQLDTEAHFLGYTPVNPLDWVTQPANGGEAIDRIAAAVVGLLGGPIP